MGTIIFWFKVMATYVKDAPIIKIANTFALTGMARY
jgi:hypothetical protein